MGLPGRYEAHVREQGKNLSTGQRQRLAIARAILRDAPILILDEPTANLDVEAEAEVMRALDNLLGDRTVIMISHRLSTLGHVDEIAVLHKGVLVERGDMSTLKNRGGMFSKLLEEQTRYSYDGARQQRRDNHARSRSTSTVRHPGDVRDA
jgi:ABC-type multidrug transport system fused ATPase/permease subunit